LRRNSREEPVAKLRDIIDIASQAYPDGLVQQAFDGNTPGDYLAEFIAQELKETFVDAPDDPVSQLQESMRVMDLARQDIQAVHQAFSEMIVQCKKVKNAKRKDLPLLIGKMTYPMAQRYLEERLKEVR
jgi:hypothetical protein